MTAALIVAATALGGVVMTVMVHLVADEFSGWLPLVSKATVKAATRRLPFGHQGRYEEEWLGELDAFRDRPLTGLAWAIRVWLGAKPTGAELGPAETPGSSTVAVGDKSDRHLRVTVLEADLVPEGRLQLEPSSDTAHERIIVAFADANIRRPHSQWSTKRRRWRG